MKTILGNSRGATAMSALLLVLLAIDVAAVSGEERAMPKTMLRQQHGPRRELWSWADIWNLLGPHHGGSHSGGDGGDGGGGDGDGGDGDGGDGDGGDGNGGDGDGDGGDGGDGSDGGGSSGGGDGENRVGEGGGGYGSWWSNRWDGIKCFFDESCDSEDAVVEDPYPYNNEGGSSDTVSTAGEGALSRASPVGIWALAISALVVLTTVAAFIIVKKKTSMAEEASHPLDGGVAKRMALMPAKGGGDAASLAGTLPTHTSAPTIIPVKPSADEASESDESGDYVNMERLPEGNGLVPEEPSPGGGSVSSNDGSASTPVYLAPAPASDEVGNGYAGPGGPMWAAAGAAATAAASGVTAAENAQDDGSTATNSTPVSI